MLHGAAYNSQKIWIFCHMNKNAPDYFLNVSLLEYSAHDVDTSSTTTPLKNVRCCLCVWQQQSVEADCTICDFHNFGLIFAGQMHCLPQKISNNVDFSL